LMIVGAALSSARAAHFRNAHLREKPLATPRCTTGNRTDRWGRSSC
jgi:hypothetical protein